MKIYLLCSGKIVEKVLKVYFSKYKEKHPVVGLCGPDNVCSIFKDNSYDVGEQVLLDPTNNQESLLQRSIARVNPDIILSIQYPWILSTNLLKQVNDNVINLHNAALPDYRGHNSISHAILNGDDYYVSTLHWVEAVVDRGRTIDKESVNIYPNDTAFSLWERSAEACSRVMNRFFDKNNSVSDICEGVLIENGGRFYSKNSLNALKNVPLGSDFNYMHKIARATHFPPHIPAYIEHNGKRIYLTIDSQS